MTIEPRFRSELKARSRVFQRNCGSFWHDRTFRQMSNSSRENGRDLADSLLRSNCVDIINGGDEQGRIPGVGMIDCLPRSPEATVPYTSELPEK